MKISLTLLIIALVGILAVAFASNICGKTKMEHEGMYHFLKAKMMEQRYVHLINPFV
jgi:hypothetical protein